MTHVFKACASASLSDFATSSKHFRSELVLFVIIAVLTAWPLLLMLNALRISECMGWAPARVRLPGSRKPSENLPSSLRR